MHGPSENLDTNAELKTTVRRQLENLCTRYKIQTNLDELTEKFAQIAEDAGYDHPIIIYSEHDNDFLVGTDPSYPRATTWEIMAALTMKNHR